ncbi:MAG: hypothetical protein QM811_16915 [Pirellulales bacterium]
MKLMTSGEFVPTAAVLKLIEDQQANVEFFHEELFRESDRGCALFAGAFLDVQLVELLKLYLVVNTSIDKELFKGTSPLSTFSSRITISYYLGLVSKSLKGELDIIRKIRNEFAHELRVNSFEIETVKNRCVALRYSYHTSDATPRHHFISAATGAYSKIIQSTLQIQNHSEKPDCAPTNEEKERFRARFFAEHGKINFKS